MPRHRMSAAEYASLGKSIREMRKNEPSLKPTDAYERVNAQLVNPVAYSWFSKQWNTAPSSKNGRGRKKVRRAPKHPRGTTAVVHVEDQPIEAVDARGATHDGNPSSSKIRMLWIEGEFASSDLERITQTFVGMLRG